MSGTGTSSTTTASQSSPGPESETYGVDLTLSGSKLEFTRMRWYWGKEALARCKKEGLKPDGAWCNDYYFEDERRASLDNPGNRRQAQAA